MSASSIPLDHAPPQAYLLLENDKKSNNLGSILRCACAHGISTIVAVGYSKCSVEGSHGAAKYVEIVAFPTIDQAVDFLRADGKSVSLVGILGGLPILSPNNTKNNNNATGSFQVFDDPSSGLVQILQQNNNNLRVQHDSSNKVLENVCSFPVFDSRAFEAGKDHCFVICKSRKGLTSSLASVCDRFIHVPCADMGGGLSDPPLLDLPSCLSITLHHFTEFAGYDERTFQGHKFDLIRRNYQEERKSSNNKSSASKQGQREEGGAADEEILDSLAGVFNESSDY